jgi:hypothetical protein
VHSKLRMVHLIHIQASGFIHCDSTWFERCGEKVIDPVTPILTLITKYIQLQYSLAVTFQGVQIQFISNGITLYQMKWSYNSAVLPNLR